MVAWLGLADGSVVRSLQHDRVIPARARWPVMNAVVKLRIEKRRIVSACRSVCSYRAHPDSERQAKTECGRQHLTPLGRDHIVLGDLGFQLDTMCLLHFRKRKHSIQEAGA
jgi:hypothetical protein